MIFGKFDFVCDDEMIERLSCERGVVGGKLFVI